MTQDFGHPGFGFEGRFDGRGAVELLVLVRLVRHVVVDELVVRHGGHVAPRRHLGTLQLVQDRLYRVCRAAPLRGRVPGIRDLQTALAYSWCGDSAVFHRKRGVFVQLLRLLQVRLWPGAFGLLSGARFARSVHCRNTRVSGLGCFFVVHVNVVGLGVIRLQVLEPDWFTVFVVRVIITNGCGCATGVCVARGSSFALCIFANYVIQFIHKSSVCVGVDVLVDLAVELTALLRLALGGLGRDVVVDSDLLLAVFLSFLQDENYDEDDEKTASNATYCCANCCH